jgi:hypothetical protein
MSANVAVFKTQIRFGKHLFGRPATRHRLVDRRRQWIRKQGKKAVEEEEKSGERKVSISSAGLPAGSSDQLDPLLRGHATAWVG